MLVRLLFPTCHSPNPLRKRKKQKPASAGFLLAINIVMIGKINIGLGTPAIRPQAPIGVAIGYVVIKPLPPPANHSLIVKTP